MHAARVVDQIIAGFKHKDVGHIMVMLPTIIKTFLMRWLNDSSNSSLSPSMTHPLPHPQLQQKIMGFCSFSFFIHSHLSHSHPPTPYTSQIKFANHIFPIHQYPRILAISCYLLRNYFSRMTNPVPQPPFGQLNPHNHLKEKSQNSSLKGSAHHLSLSNYLILYSSNQHTWTSWS